METREAIHFNEKKAVQFADEIFQIINGGTLTLMISIGHRTGLFDSMKEMKPAGFETIADKANLHPRYVKEWLGAMVTGGIVEYDEYSETYHLPVEHAAYLTRSAGADNVGIFSQYVGILGSVEDDIIQCFYEGGGVPYEKFHRFHEVMAEDSGQSVLSSIFDRILPLIPGISDKLEQGISVLDIGCGSGRAINMLAEAFPNSSFLGLDLCEEPILKARKEADEKGNTNTWFEIMDLTTYSSDSKYDLITAFDVIHDQARPDKVLKMVHDALKEDGVFLMQDINGSSNLSENKNHPLGSMLYSISTMHCMTVSLAQGGMGLGTMWGVDTAEKMLREAGFTRIEVHQLEHDVQNAYFVIRK
jgi:2-polyprenyl-3-methyl-5-hydroxy-6-metoxy-1,4-benzoquinol methylase